MYNLQSDAFPYFTSLLTKYKSFLGSHIYKNVALILVYKSIAKIPRNYDSHKVSDFLIVIADVIKKHISEHIEVKNPETKEEIEEHKRCTEDFAKYTKSIRFVLCANIDLDRKFDFLTIL